MIRLIRGPDGELGIDLAQKFGGRGAWITAARDSLDAPGSERKLLAGAARAFAGPVRIDGGTKNLAQRIEDLLVRRIKELIGLEHRAGRLVVGTDRVARSLKHNTVDMVLVATDASDRTANAMTAAPRGRGEIETFRLLSRNDMSNAVGRENVVMIGLTAKRATTRLPADLLRLAAFRGKALPDTENIETTASAAGADRKHD